MLWNIALETHNPFDIIFNTDGSYNKDISETTTSWAIVPFAIQFDSQTNEPMIYRLPIMFGKKENDPFAKDSNNIAGEVYAALEANTFIKNYLTSPQIISEITIKSDYQGIQGWAGNWKTNSKIAIFYKQSLLTLQQEQVIKPMFAHIQGHMNDLGNEICDFVAKAVLNSSDTLTVDEMDKILIQHAQRTNNTSGLPKTVTLKTDDLNITPELITQIEGAHHLKSYLTQLINQNLEQDTKIHE